MVEVNAGDEECQAIAPALHELTQHAGWKVLVSLLERAANDTARQMLRDREMTQDFARGYVEACEAVPQRVESIIARAREIEGESVSVENALPSRLGLGGGSLAE
jgi:hypothetical protein